MINVSVAASGVITLFNLSMIFRHIIKHTLLFSGNFRQVVTRSRDINIQYIANQKKSTPVKLQN